MSRSHGWCRRLPAFVVSLLGLFIALTGVGYAATGGKLTLGHANTASKGTTLRSKGGPSLTLTNTGGKPAASFNVLRGKPPFAVNSTAKVKGLNADLLDGIDSSALQRRVAQSCSAGMAIRVINADGSVSCQPVTGATGRDRTNRSHRPRRTRRRGLGPHRQRRHRPDLQFPGHDRRAAIDLQDQRHRGDAAVGGWRSRRGHE